MGSLHCLIYMLLNISTYINQLQSQTLTAAQKQTILDRHNSARNKVANGKWIDRIGNNLTTAANMNQLLWVHIHAQFYTYIYLVRNSPKASDKH